MPDAKVLRRPGDIISRVEIMAYNQTGGALVDGDTAALNIDFANSSYVGIAEGDTTNVWANAVAVTTENMSRTLVWAKGAIASGALGTFVLEGITNCKVASTPNKGEYLIGTNASASLTPQTLTELDALATPTGIVGIVLETSATNPVVVKCWVDGNGWKHLIGGGG